VFLSALKALRVRPKRILYSLYHEAYVRVQEEKVQIVVSYDVEKRPTLFPRSLIFLCTYLICSHTRIE